MAPDHNAEIPVVRANVIALADLAPENLRALPNLPAGCSPATGMNPCSLLPSLNPTAAALYLFFPGPYLATFHHAPSCLAHNLAADARPPPLTQKLPGTWYTGRRNLHPLLPPHPPPLPLAT